MAGSRLTAGGDGVCRALYLRMCVGRGEEHSRGFHPGGKTHSQEWLCHVPSTSYWAKGFGVPLGLAWGKFRLSRTSGLIVPAYARCGRGEEHSGGFHPGGKSPTK